ncbi:MAG: CHRD domain-containing protein [Solirubrobacteraceae bacterium]
MRTRIQLAGAVALLAVLGVVGAAVAGGGGHKISERLTGYEETPQTLSTPASGEFKARIGRPSDEIRWRLSYRGFESDVTQAHIHFGARALSGGISVWLCGNPNPPAIVPPAGTATCPLREGTVTGTIEADDVVGPAGQGISAMEFDEFVDAVRAEATYANVHTVNRGSGEIRAQLDDDKDRHRGGRD